MPMVIIVDSREKARAIQKVLAEFDKHGIRHYSSKLFCGDYQNVDNAKLVIDRKQNLSEICNNVSSVPKKNSDGTYKRRQDGRTDCDLYRFTDELQRAKECGIHLIVLCEHGGQIKTLQDVEKWKNPRLKESPLAMSGERLYRVLLQLEKTYDVEFQFCDKRTTGKRIIELLGGIN